MFTRSIFPALAYFTALASAEDTLQPDANGCVNPAGLKSCVDQEDVDFVTCGTQCNQTAATRNYNDCIVGCDTFRTSAYLGCQVQSCWNHVYGCEYQLWARKLIKDAGKVADSKGIPFYPPPDGASGACSCNIGVAFTNLETRLDSSICLQVAQTTDETLLNYCECCDRIQQVSAAINTCPDYDLNIIGLDSFIASTANSATEKNFDCSEILNNDKCTEQFGFQLANGTEFYNPTAFPSGVPGTKTVSDVGSFTTFPGPQTTVIELGGGYTRTITMEEWKEGKSGATETAATGAEATTGGDTKSAAGGTARGGLGLVALASTLVALLW